MQQNQGHRPTLTMSNSAPRKPIQTSDRKSFDYGKKRIPGSQRALSHDKEIKRLKDSGESTTLLLMSGIEYTGVIVDSDKYSIRIKTSIETLTFFKHAIEGFKQANQ